jgi:hypothetical protein
LALTPGEYGASGGDDPAGVMTSFGIANSPQ